MIDSTVFSPSAWAMQAVPAESKSTPISLYELFSLLDLLSSVSSLAFAETRLALARILYNFDVEGLPCSRGWASQQKAYLLWDKKPFWASLKPVR